MKKFLKIMIFFALICALNVQLLALNSTSLNDLAHQIPKSESIKHKFKKIISWCKKNPGKTFLIGTSVVVASVGAGFWVYKVNRDKKIKENPNLENPKILFNLAFIDRKHKNDGKLPDGKKGPETKILEHNACTIEITQLPGLSQTRADCGYYTLWGLKCFGENREQEIGNRKSYEKCEIELKNILQNSELYKNYAWDIKPDLSYLNNQELINLIRISSSLHNLNTEFLDTTYFLDNLLGNTLLNPLNISQGPIEAFDEVKIKLNRPYVFVINYALDGNDTLDNPLRHWIPAKVVFEDKNKVNLKIVNSLSNCLIEGTKANSVITNVSKVLAGIANRIVD